MRLRFLPFACVLAFFVVGASNAFSETPLELVDRLRTRLQTLYDEKKAETDGHPLRGHDEKFAMQVALNQLQSVRQALASGNEESAVQSLGQLRSDNGLPEESNTALDAIIRQIRTERTNKVDAYNAAVDGACQRAAAAVLQAKEPRELDAILQELTTMTDQPVITRYGDNSGSRMNGKLKDAAIFVAHWQDYLLAHNRGDDNNARAILQNLISSNDHPPLVPRSEVLTRQPEPEGVAEARARRAAPTAAQIDASALEIFQGTKNLSDVPVTLSKLADLRKNVSSRSSYSYGSDSILFAATNSLQALQKTALELQNGLETNLNLGSQRMEYSTHPEIETALLPLRLQLIKQAVPRLIGMPEDEKSPPDEPLDAYVRRLIESVKKKHDWAAAMRGIELVRMLATANSNFYGVSSDEQVAAFKNILAAENLEQASQYEEAVTFYLIALRSGQGSLPTAWIGERLGAIRQAHPAEYARGANRSGSPARAVYENVRQEPEQTAESGAVTVPASSPSPTPSLPTATPAPSVTPGTSK